MKETELILLQISELITGKQEVVVSEQQNKRIAIVIFGGHGIGGAEKRFTNFFMCYNQFSSGLKIFLVISREKYNMLIKQFPKLSQLNNVLIINKLTPQFANTQTGKLYFRLKNQITSNKYISWVFYPFLLAKYSIQLNLTVRRNKIDLVHCFWEGITECSIIKIFNPKTTFLLSYVEPVGRFLKNRFYRNNPSFLPFALQKADAIELQCAPYLNVLKEKNVLPENKNIYIAPCSFSDYSKAKVEHKTNRVVYLARLDEHKNPFLFLEASKIILAKRKDIKFEIYGKGPLKQKIISYLVENNLHEVIKFNFTNDAFSVFAGSKVFCSLASFGSFPEQSTLEALSCKNALITTVKDGDAKFYKNDFAVTTTFSPDHLASKIEYLINNPEICNKLAEAGRRFVLKNHRIDLFSKYLSDVYNKLIKK